MKFTPKHKRFIQYIRWHQWNVISDSDRYVIGLSMHADGFKKTDAFVNKYREILNSLRGKYITDYVIHIKRND